jgi:pimeloyl-ACP methyl ester carboxylesterase
MTRRVLFIQGAGEGAHEADARMAAALQDALGPDYEVDCPPMPGEAEPDRATWARLLMQLMAGEDRPVVVGHSAGGLHLLLTLAEAPVPPHLSALLLIAAPFCGEGGWRIEGYDLPRDLAGRLPPGLPLRLYHGDHDEVVPFAHLDLYARILPQAAVRRLPGRDHQLNEDLAEVAADIRALQPQSGLTDPQPTA